MRRPGFLHTSPVHVAAFDALLAEASPGVRALHLVDESLLADARTAGAEAVARRVAAGLAALRERGAEVVCCTCSTIGAVAERADVGIPVLRVDRPMAIRAVAAGPRIGVVAALASTREPTRSLLAEAAAAEGRDAEVALVTAEGAWQLFEAGDERGYLAAVAAAARRLAASCDVIVLAQASMAGAEPLLADLGIPVLSSPRTTTEYLTR